jgi:hypothetical protein
MAFRHVVIWCGGSATGWEGKKKKRIKGLGGKAHGPSPLHSVAERLKETCGGTDPRFSWSRALANHPPHSILVVLSEIQVINLNHWIPGA